MLLLGAGHGINPGMGWLFAVALGLQEQKGRAVWRALLPLALGHGLAIGVAIALAVMVGLVVPLGALKWAVAATLLAFGIYKLVRTRHPRYGGMQIGARELTIWSFLMASAHGAGLMVVPFLLGDPAAAPAGHEMMSHSPAEIGGGSFSVNAASLAAALPEEGLIGLAAALIHTAGYLFVTGLVATVVYKKLGLRLLRTMWINLDLVWAGALIITAILTPLL
ncbi:MAG: hypothetical protein GTO46_08570 [Gemmatimonadetes bacterium]|nr:hypothetical protein [Gemmatimonadota bacterium]NIO31689.1 hypothetical protein [Gemmatimonadota bacterium]